MINDDILRERTRKLKWKQGISYTELAGYLEIKTNSLYNWLKGQYNLSESKERQLLDILDTLGE